MQISRFGSVYCIENKNNGRKYIGQTSKSVEERWKTHIRRSKVITGPLNVDIIEFGESAFTITELWVAFDEEGMDFAEKYFIKEEQSLYPEGYNIQSGGKRFEFQAESTKEKLRHRSLEYFSDPTNREKVSERSKAQMSDPVKKARHKEAYNNPQTRAKIRAVQIDRIWITDGTKNRRLRKHLPIPEGWKRGVSGYGEAEDCRANAQALGRHNRWHYSRGIKNPNCKFCLERDLN